MSDIAFLQKITSKQTWTEANKQHLQHDLHWLSPCYWC